MSLDKAKTFKRTTFSCERLRDFKVLEALRGICEDFSIERSSVQVEFAFIDGSFDFALPETSDTNPKISDYLTQDSISVQNFKATVSGVSISVERPLDTQQTHLLKGASDLVSLAINEGFDTGNPGVKTFSACLSSARAHLSPIDTLSYRDVLNEVDNSIFQSRETAINRLERLQEGFFTTLRKEHARLRKEHQERLEELTKEYENKRSDLDKAHEIRAAELLSQSDDLAKRETELQELRHKHSRARIQGDVDKKLDELLKSFELTAGSRNKRWAVLSLAGLMMIVFGGAAGWISYSNVSNPTTSVPIIAWVSQITWTLAFFGVGTFTIRWLNDWSKRHADAEFRLKQLQIDFKRASWLVDLAFEWRNAENGGEIPQHLVDKLSVDLFSATPGESSSTHPLETFVTGLIGENGKANVKMPAGGELSVERGK
jgi:hypothetical protein